MKLSETTRIMKQCIDRPLLLSITINGNRLERRVNVLLPCERNNRRYAGKKSPKSSLPWKEEATEQIFSLLLFLAKHFHLEQEGAGPLQQVAMITPGTNVALLAR